MRNALAMGLVLLAGLSLGQVPEVPNLFTTEKQDVTIVVRKSRLGPDDLTVTVEDTYPKEQLQGQIQRHRPATELRSPRAQLQRV